MAQVEGACGTSDARGEARLAPPRAAAGERGLPARALPVSELPTRGCGGQARGGHEHQEEQRGGAGRAAVGCRSAGAQHPQTSRERGPAVAREDTAAAQASAGAGE